MVMGKYEHSRRWSLHSALWMCMNVVDTNQEAPCRGMLMSWICCTGVEILLKSQNPEKFKPGCSQVIRHFSQWSGRLFDQLTLNNFSPHCVSKSVSHLINVFRHKWLGTAPPSFFHSSSSSDPEQRMVCLEPPFPNFGFARRLFACPAAALLCGQTSAANKRTDPFDATITVKWPRARWKTPSAGNFHESSGPSRRHFSPLWGFLELYWMGLMSEIHSERHWTVLNDYYYQYSSTNWWPVFVQGTNSSYKKRQMFERNKSHADWETFFLLVRQWGQSSTDDL